MESKKGQERPFVDKGKMLLQVLGISIRMKSRLSRFILVCSIPGALLPALLSVKLQGFTDALVSLGAGKSESVGVCFALLIEISILFLGQIMLTSLQAYAKDEDSAGSTEYILEETLRCKCQVRYPYIENKDKFLERIERVERFAKERIVESVSMVVGLAATIVTMVSAALLLWKVNPWIVALIIVTSVPAAWISYTQHNESFYWSLQQSESSALAGYYYGLCTGKEFRQELRHYKLYSYFCKKWDALVEERHKEKKKILVKHISINVVVDVLRSCIYLGVLLITAWQIYQNPLLGLGVFTLVFSLTRQLQNAVHTTLTTSALFLNFLPYMEEYLYVKGLEQEEQGEDTGRLKQGEIICTGVSFSYPDAAQEALHEITVTIKDGEKVAIVGENGSGKSTFISLLSGMLRPDSGNIQIGGSDVKTETGKVRNSLSVVFQNFARYEDTVRNNIAVSGIEACEKENTDARIWSLLRGIHMDSFFASLKDGLDTRIGSFSESGDNLSGGQWQRVAIARAAYREESRIMILDEPTSSLDPLAEAQLYEDFSKLTGERTTLLVSHRLGVTAVVDRILVFKNGRIVEDGTHEELMKQNGEYKRMYQAQAQWYR